MELSATVFLGIVLRIFAALDTAMVISLLRPGMSVINPHLSRTFGLAGAIQRTVDALFIPAAHGK